MPVKASASAAMVAAESVSTSFAPAATSSTLPKRVTPVPNRSAPCATRVCGCDEFRSTVSVPSPAFVNVASDAPDAAVNAGSIEMSNPDGSSVKPFSPIVADAQPQRNGTGGVVVPLTFSVPPSATSCMHGSPVPGTPPRTPRTARTPLDETETTLRPPTGTLFVTYPPGNVTTASSVTLSSRSASNP